MNELTRLRKENAALRRMNRVAHSSPAHRRIWAIQEAVAAHYGIPIACMTNRRRPDYIAYPRMVAMALCRELCPEYPLTAIGATFGGRVHTAVTHAAQAVRNRTSTEQQADSDYRALKEKLT